MQAITLADRTMRGAGFDAPRIAVAALNPHGGENGLFGREEIEIIAPAVARAAERGVRVPRTLSFGHRVPQGLCRRLRRRPDDVSRPGTDRHQAQGLQSRRHCDRRTCGRCSRLPRTAPRSTSSARAVATTGALEQAVRLVRASGVRSQEQGDSSPTRPLPHHSPKQRTTFHARLASRGRRFPRRVPYRLRCRLRRRHARTGHPGRRGPPRQALGARRHRPRHSPAPRRKPASITRRYLAALGIATRARQHRDRQRYAPARPLRGVRQRNFHPRRRLRRHSARRRQGSRLRPAHPSDGAGAAAGAGARREGQQERP